VVDDSQRNDDGDGAPSAPYIDDDADAADSDDVQTTARTVRELTERAAAAAVTSSPPTGNTIGPEMHRPGLHRPAAADRSLSSAVQPPPPEVESKPKPKQPVIGSPKIDRRPEVAESKRRSEAEETVADGSAPMYAGDNSEESCRPLPTSTQPEIVIRRTPPAAVRNRKPTCHEARSEQFDRVVQYFDSRQRISGRLTCSVL